MKKLKNKKVLLIAIPVLVLLVGLAVGGSVILMNEDKNKSKNEVKEESPKELTEDVINATELKLKENYEVKVGTNLEEIDWLEFVENKDELTEDDKHKFNGLSFEAVDTSKVGEYEYVLKYDNKLHTGKITVKEKEEEKKEEVKEDKKETASSSSSKNNTSTSKPSTNTSTTKPSNNTSSSSSNNSSSSSNNTAPAPTPTPEPEVFKVPAMSVTKNGFTITSDGNNGGTISWNGHSAKIKWFESCANNYCTYDARLDSPTGANTNVLFISSKPEKSVAAYSKTNNEIIITLMAPEYSSLAELSNTFGISITNFSYQVKDTSSLIEAANAYGRHPWTNPDAQYVFYTYDYNFRNNGLIYITGTKNANYLQNENGKTWYDWVVEKVN